jgi:hypothetical protein
MRIALVRFPARLSGKVVFASHPAASKPANREGSEHQPSKRPCLENDLSISGVPVRHNSVGTTNREETCATC